MPKVSVIVPVYKVEAYLDECVTSICNQTLSDIEILLIDDGSPDKCPEMCDKWQQTDTRIRVFHKTNGGLSDARNCGLDHATGEFIAFVDSDDKIAPDMLQKMYDACKKHDTKISICNVIYWYPNDVRVNSNDLNDLRETQCIKFNCLCNDLHNVACRKIYHRSLFSNNTNRFPKGLLHEDVGFWWLIMSQIQSIAVVRDALYIYRQNNPNSICAIKDKTRHCSDSILSYYFGLSEGLKYISPERRTAYACTFLRRYLKTACPANANRKARKIHFRILDTLKPYVQNQNNQLLKDSLAYNMSSNYFIVFRTLRYTNKFKFFISFNLFGIPFIHISIGKQYTEM